MMKIKGLFLSLMAAAVIFTGCGSTGDNTDKDKDTGDDTDVVTSASVATDAESLKTAMGEDGTWIIVVQQDLTVDEELVLEGEVAKRGGEYEMRKLALYDQDDDGTITDSYTLTAPKITIKADKTILKGGVIVGDLYVEANNVILDNMKIEGNVYFSSEEVKSSFTLNESEVTGNQEVQ